MKKLILSLACAAFLLSAAPREARADDDIDMAKITCKEFIESKKDEMSMLIIWMDGYLSAKSDDTVMSDEWMKKLGEHMGSYCAKHPQRTIMAAMKAMPSN